MPIIVNSSEKGKILEGISDIRAVYVGNTLKYGIPGTDDVVMQPLTVYISENGTPQENIDQVMLRTYGGIENFIGEDDVVVINPNGQWTNQGTSNVATMIGLINSILNRPGGFNGEVIVTENLQFMGTGGGWSQSASITNNGPVNLYNMINHADYYGNVDRVNGVLLRRNSDDSVVWPVVSGPEDGQGWVRPTWSPEGSDTTYTLSYPIIRSPYSNKLIDLKNGVYDETNGYEGQPELKFIKMPNINNHGSSGSHSSYAGVTSAVKSFLGIVEQPGSGSGGAFPNGTWGIHSWGNNAHGTTGDQRAYRNGSCGAAWMDACRKPDCFITTAEYVGWESRTGQAAHARIVGLCSDPATLDYIMMKYVFYPIVYELSAQSNRVLFHPDYNEASGYTSNYTRLAINGMIDGGYGTANEEDITVIWDDLGE